MPEHKVAVILCAVESGELNLGAYRGLIQEKASGIITPPFSRGNNHQTAAAVHMNRGHTVR